MQKHLLLEKAKCYKRKTELTPPSSSYNQNGGYWVDVISGKAIILNENLYSTCATKKEDIETGEDQKGE